LNNIGYFYNEKLVLGYVTQIIMNRMIFTTLCVLGENCIIVPALEVARGILTSQKNIVNI
jgi:hypothetical protein